MQLNPVDSSNKTLSMPCCKELHYHLQINNSKENVRKMLPDSFFLHTSHYIMPLTSMLTIILAGAKTNYKIQHSAKQEITLVMAEVFQFAK